MQFDFSKNRYCRTCGKDIYRSSTGCLCPPGKADHVDGDLGTFGEGNTKGLLQGPTKKVAAAADAGDTVSKTTTETSKE
jgi:hypothetical protein